MIREPLHATVLDDNGEFHTGIRALRHEELTAEEIDRGFCFHAATGGDMIFLANGEVLQVP